MLFLPLLATEFYLILLLAAVIPAVWLLVRVYRADRLESEPPGLLLRLLLLGILSTHAAALLERLLGGVLSALVPGGTLYRFLLYFLVVGLSEEGVKYLCLRTTWRSPHFNCLFDGTVYAVTVSLGFALWENIQYVMAYGLSTAAARAVTAVPGHACFGVFMGVFYGAAKRLEGRGDPDGALRGRVAAVAIPTLLHGLYDFIASGTGWVYSLLFLVFVVALFTYAGRLVNAVSRRDEYL